MTGNQTLILGLVFVTTFFIVGGSGYWLFGFMSPARRRLREIADPEGRVTSSERREGAFTVRWAEPLAKVLLPPEGWRRSRMKSRLVQAGLRGKNALTWLLTSKLIGAFVLPLLIVLPLLLLGMFGEKPTVGVALMTAAALIGFLGPDWFVQHKLEQRQLLVIEGFPDALDMLVVCVEAGLSLDAAVQRVSREMKTPHPALAEEMQLVSLELRAGKSRDDALKGLADRTGVHDINALVSILIQAEHFGTSIASSLREHADDMRLVRIQRAREKAAKLPVKLIFPVVLFIFPALFLVILGPAVVRIFKGFIVG